MGYVGWDELSKISQASSSTMNFTGNTGAGAGYRAWGTRSKNERNQSNPYHVKWHAITNWNVVDRFHVKNEYTEVSIYYGIEAHPPLEYFKEGVNGPRTNQGWYNYASDSTFHDCKDIAYDFLDAIDRAGIKVYNSKQDAQDAYDARKAGQQNETARMRERDDAAREYTLTHNKLPEPLRSNTPKLNQELRGMTPQAIKLETAKLQDLLPKTAPATTVQAPFVVLPPLPPGFQMQPGPTPLIALAGNQPIGKKN